jgi:hypothetical protein
MRALLRRRLSWFYCAESPQGFVMPARLSQRIIALLAALPFTLLLSRGLGEPAWIATNLGLLVVAITDDLMAFEAFMSGVGAGRQEASLDLIDAWEQHRIEPNEFIVRELEFDQDLIREARRTVRRSARGRPPTKGPF